MKPFFFRTAKNKESKNKCRKTHTLVYIRAIFLSGLLFLLSNSVAFAQTNRLRFSQFSLNSKNDLLFSLETTSTNGTPYKTLFVKRANSPTVEQLTFFPEHLEVFADGSIVQVINKLGSITLNIGSNEISNTLHLKQFSVFEQSNLQQNFESLQVSPSGRFISLVEPVDFVFGNLVVLDLKTGLRYFVTDKALQHIRAITWAPDDSGFVYENNGALYFSRPAWLLQHENQKDNFSAVKIAETSIDSVHWLDKDTFYLVEKTSIYEVNTHQLLSFSLYDSILNVKKKIASMPFSVSPNDSHLFFSTSGKSLLVIKSKQHLYYLNWDKENISMEAQVGIPYLLLPEVVTEFKVFWQDENPLIYFNSIHDTTSTTHSWHVAGNQFAKIPLEAGEVFLSFSPHAQFALIQKEGLFYVKQLSTKTSIFKIGGEPIISSVWANDSTLLVGTESELVKINLQNLSAETILISQVSDFSWGQNDTDILATSYFKPEYLFQYDRTSSSWLASPELRLQEKKLFNANYRVYLDQAGGIFSNMIYLRSLTEVGTNPLLPLLPYYHNSNDVYVSEKASKKIAIVFDIMESTDGLPHILFALQQAQVRATFFVTGTAISLYPTDISHIVQSGHQCASLFLSPINLSDSKYKITDEFIQSGLARTEDLFYKATGAELSLFWHSPWYVTSEQIEQIAHKAGYTFVLPTIIIPDWLTAETKEYLPDVAQNVYACINYILQEARDGAIVPIQLSSRDNDEYLVYKIDLLISLLQKYGYEIVPIQELTRY
ncbi:MAG: polysaccharide deacetylase family protein [Spirochaetaceae bacterium]|nr:polysaccharide deacetylase family protein [Spirochaetaceae bacterium]